MNGFQKTKLTVTVFFCIMLLVHLAACGNAKIERNTNQPIYEEAIDVINDNLLAPASAIYPEYEPSFVTDMETEKVYEDINYHLYSVEAYVDSNNAFGTLVRQKYGVIIGIPTDQQNVGTSYYEVQYLE